MIKEDAISLLKQVNEILINSNSWLENTHEPLNQAFGMAIKALEQQSDSDDVMAIHTQGLTEGIRCAMCTNSMKSDRGCDGGCVVDNEMYKKVIDTINNQMFSQPTSEDCVSRQAVFETIDDCNSDGLKGIFCSYDDGERFKEYIKKLPPVTPTQRWIPVSEELPKKNMRCLVSVGSLNLTEIAMYSDLMGTIDHKIFWQGDYGHDTFRDITKYVRAWQPLPKPYEEKRGSEE